MTFADINTCCLSAGKSYKFLVLPKLIDAAEMDFLSWETRDCDTFPVRRVLLAPFLELTSESVRRNALPTSRIRNWDDNEETEFCLDVTEDGKDDDPTGSRIWDIFDPFEQL